MLKPMISTSMTSYVNRDLQQKLHESGVDGSAAGASMSTVNQTHLGQIFMYSNINVFKY
jgi:hypothetical protein